MDAVPIVKTFCDFLCILRAANPRAMSPPTGVGVAFGVRPHG